MTSISSFQRFPINIPDLSAIPMSQAIQSSLGGSAYAKHTLSARDTFSPRFAGSSTETILPILNKKLEMEEQQLIQKAHKLVEGYVSLQKELENLNNQLRKLDEKPQKNSTPVFSIKQSIQDLTEKKGEIEKELKDIREILVPGFSKRLASTDMGRTVPQSVQALRDEQTNDNELIMRERTDVEQMLADLNALGI